MPKHTHLKSMEEQITNTGHGCAPFHYHQGPHQESQSGEFGDIITKKPIVDSVIQLCAYQIHEEKGGTDFDNWLEAEQLLGDANNSK
jgi:hypothetical protein